MSYNVYCEGLDELGEEWNFTSNCASMWRKAGADIASFHGKRAGDCVTPMAAAVENLIEFPGVFRLMDDPGDWGTYDQLLPRMIVLLQAFRECPDAVVEVSR